MDFPAQYADLSTRDRMLVAARTMFSERGFYGVSIAQVAAALGMSKQALLHHFGSKERLYGEVLQSVSRELDSLLTKTVAERGGGAECLAEIFVRLQPGDEATTERSRLLVRELLDNARRAGDATTWYLAPFLGELETQLGRCENWRDTKLAVRRAALFRWLGAVEYTVIAGPTLRAIYGDEGSTAMWQETTRTLRSTMLAQISAGPPRG
ncbi:helix-turn-helix domain containing protein [Erythrobacteraceae bacterium WH01K]|nr:helix-turn-helix domain containing protein [Erythrobacteraceae bacterium WH01K]